MKTNFELDLKGSTIFKPFFIGWLVVMAVAVVMALTTGTAGYSSSAMITQMNMQDPVLNASYLGNSLLNLVFNFFIYLAMFSIYFFVIKYTLQGLSLGDEKFEPNYNFGEYFKMILLGTFLTTITFYIYFPWFIAKMIRYFSSNTSYKFNTFDFRSRGGTLFSYMILFVVVPMFIMMFVASMFVITAAAGTVVAGGMGLLMILMLVAFFVLLSVYEALYMRWLINFTHGSRRIVNTAKGWPAGWFILGQIALSVITAFIYMPMAMIRIYRYFVNRTVIGDDKVDKKMEYNLRTWPDYGLVLGQSLLAIITLGIYFPWAYTKIMQRLLSQTSVEDVETHIAMPATDQE